MKPYLVQRLESGAPIPGAAPLFVLAPSPMAAARKAGRDRRVHAGRALARLRVEPLQDGEHAGVRAAHEYVLQFQSTVAACWRA